MAASRTGRKGDITTYMQYVNDFVRLTAANRVLQQRDVNYFHGIQLSREEVYELEARKQPVIIVNRQRAAINGMIGVQVQQNVQPRAWPRTPDDENSADVATDVLRYVAEANQFKKVKTDVLTDLLNAGVAGVALAIGSDKDIVLTPIMWNELLYDPRSRKKDFSDAGYMGIYKWVYADDVKALYPHFDIEDVTISGNIAGLSDDPGADRPRVAGWISADKRRVLLVELHYREGGNWYKAVFTSGGVLEEGAGWLKDQKGRYVCPIIAASPYVDDDNNRYGVGRDMVYLSDEINKRRSKLLHLLNVAQIQAKDPSAIEVDADAARKEAARPDGVIPFGWERVRNQDLVQGQQQLLAESKSELERMGPNPAILGRQGSDTSGKALSARQEAGMIEMAPVFAVMDDLELRVYRAAWCAVQQYWDAPKYIRITDEVEDPSFVMVNQPIMGQVPGIDAATGQPAVDPTTGQPVMVQDVLGYKNKLAELDVDIILDTVPATPNVMAEQLANLMDLIARNPAYSAQVPADVLFELTPIPRKRDVMKRIKASVQQAQQAQAQAQQQQAQVEQAKTEAQVAKDQSVATLNTAKAQEAGFNAVTYADQVKGQNAVAEKKLAVDAMNKFIEHSLVKQAQDAQARQQGGPGSFSR